MPSNINQITDEDVQAFASVVDGNLHDPTDKNALDEYQRIATKTAIYPGNDTPLGLMYVALKMNGEAGEFAEHVGKAFRDDGLVDRASEDSEEQTMRPTFFCNGLTPEREEALLKEVGDVLWYLSAACNELGVSLSDVALKNLQKLNDRTKRNKLSGSGDNR
jgi:NTP pyrophosphatase (non-canonical NTP hydrolase)